MRPLFRSLSASAWPCSVAACTTPNPTPLDRPGDVPQGFTAPAAQGGPTWPDAAWWLNFKADELGPLEDTAAKENLDIAQYAARVLEAEAADGVAFSGVLPTLGASGGVTRNGGNSLIPRAQNSFSAGFSASYEQNIFGQQFDQLRGAREDLRAARYAKAAIDISIASQVADQYFTVLSLRERIAIDKSNIEAAKRILAITQAKGIERACCPISTWSEQQGPCLAQQESRLPGLVEQEREARYALAHPARPRPGRLRRPGAEPGQYRFAQCAVRPCRRKCCCGRPDISEGRSNAVLRPCPMSTRRARPSSRRSASPAPAAGTPAPSATCSIPAAWCGTSAPAWRRPSSTAAASTPRAIRPGRARPNCSPPIARRCSAPSAKWNRAIGTVQASRDQLTLLDAQVKASADAFRISELQYREGTIDILSLLTAQQNLFTAQDSYVTTKLTRLEANIGLYQALGGGWTQQADDSSYQYQLDWWPL